MFGASKQMFGAKRQVPARGQSDQEAVKSGRLLRKRPLRSSHVPMGCRHHAARRFAQCRPGYLDALERNRGCASAYLRSRAFTLAMATSISPARLAWASTGNPLPHSLAATNKCLAQINNSPDRDGATKKRKPLMNGYRQGVEATENQGELAMNRLLKPLAIAATLIAMLAPATATEIGATISEEQARESSLSLAGSSIVFAQFCEREFNSLTPLQRDALMFYVRSTADKYGKDAVKAASAKSYEEGYYKLGDTWCPIGRSMVRSMASAMTRR
jgi:hypothetical protein